MTKDIILHAGLPKTGTTPVQRALYTDRDALFGLGYYSDTLVNSPNDPKHLWVLHAVRTPEPELETRLFRVS